MQALQRLHSEHLPANSRSFEEALLLLTGTALTAGSQSIQAGPPTQHSLCSLQSLYQEHRSCQGSLAQHLPGPSSRHSSCLRVA